MKPTVGRIVHYQSYGTPKGEYMPAAVAAIITRVNNDEKNSVALTVFNPLGLFFPQEVPYSETPEPGHWSWPPRE